MNTIEAREVAAQIRKGTYSEPYQVFSNEPLSIGWTAFGAIFIMPFFAMLGVIGVTIVGLVITTVFPQTLQGIDGIDWSFFHSISSPWAWGAIYVGTCACAGATFALIHNHLPRSLLILTPWGIVQDIPGHPRQFFCGEFAQLQYMTFYEGMTTVSRGDDWDHESYYYYHLTYKDRSQATWYPHRAFLDKRVFAAIDEALKRYDPALTSELPPLTPPIKRYGNGPKLFQGFDDPL